MKSVHTHECSSDHAHTSHEASLWSELMCHLPYAAFSVALGFVFLSVLHFLGLPYAGQKFLKKGYHMLFHSFHYLHIIFAATGTFVTFSRFSRRISAGILLSVISPLIFCTLSDVAFPSLAAQLLGVNVHMHVCFFDWHDTINLMPFLVMGVICGFALRQHHETYLGFFSLASHFVHILISSLAALCYLASSGFEAWHSVMGLLFFFLVVAVVVPCTISDIVVPWYFARRARVQGGQHAGHSH